MNPVHEKGQRVSKLVVIGYDSVAERKDGATLDNDSEAALDARAAV